MKHFRIASLAIPLLLLGTSVFSQTYRATYITSLVLVGNKGADIKHSTVLLMPSTSTNDTLILPNANLAGALVNDGSGNLSWSSSGGGGILSHISETYSTTSPYSAIASGEELQASGTASNIDLVLSSKGNGAVYANAADNTSTGGNLRGTNAVDWQMSRTANTQVASGNYAVVSGGQNNAAGGIYSAIPGGQNLTLSNAGDFGFNSGANAMTVATSNISTFANTDLWLANNDNTARALVLYAPNTTTGAFPNGTKYVGLKAGAVTSSVTYTLPLADATASGQVLYSNGSGTLNWGSYLPIGGGTLSTSSSSPLLNALLDRRCAGHGAFDERGHGGHAKHGFYPCKWFHDRHERCSSRCRR